MKLINKVHKWTLINYYINVVIHYCCKMRINVTQIKVEMTMYYFNNIYIYILGKKSNRRNVKRMKERKREWEEENIFLLLGMLLTCGVRSLL